MKNIKFILLSLFILLILFGCSPNIKEINPSLEEAKIEEENLKPKEGGQISISVVAFETLNPLLNKEKSLDEGLKLLYDSLFTLDENYNISPKLVKDYDFVENGNVLNINLKDNIYWHDGVKLTSEDVKFTIEQLKNFPESPYYPLVKNIQSVSTLGEDRFYITFEEPYSFSLESLIFPIVPKHKLDGLNKENMMKEENNLVGCGMYQIKKYEKRKYILLNKNDNYYNNKPYIEEIKMVIVPDKETQESMMISLETDICKIEDIISGKFTPKKFKTEKYMGEDYEFLALNFNHEYLKDINVRKALVYGIDRQKILKEVYIKEGDIVDFPLNLESKYYDKNLKSYKYDVEKAKEHLAKSNLQDIQFNLIVNQDNYAKVKTAYIIKENLEKLNISVFILELPEEEITNKLSKGEYDLALLGWKLPIVPDPTFALKYNGSSNFTNYADENMDLLLQKLLASVNEEEKIKNYYALEKYIKNQLPYISLLIRDENLVLNNKIKGNLESNGFNIYNGIENIFVNY